MTDERSVIRAREDVLAVAAYRQGKAPSGGFKLSSNENPFDPLPEVREAFAAANQLNRYGTPPMNELRSKIAQHFATWGADGEAADFDAASLEAATGTLGGAPTGSACAATALTADHVHLGAGSVTILFELIQAVAGPGDNYVYAWPSFEAYPGLGVASGATSKQVPLREDATHDIDAMIAAVDDRTRAVIVCSPNNPTGPIVKRAEFERLMSAVPSDVLVILDEAYIEFVRDSEAIRGNEVLDRYPNLAVLRTLSKAFGLATLRIGYGLARPEIWSIVKRVAIPLSISSPAEAAALRSLDPDVFAQVQDRVAQLVDRRDRVIARLREAGLALPDSQSNFVWVPASVLDPESVAEAFFARGTSVRAIAGHGTRITIAEEESLDEVVEVLTGLAGC